MGRLLGHPAPKEVWGLAVEGTGNILTGPSLGCSCAGLTVVLRTESLLSPGGQAVAACGSAQGLHAVWGVPASPGKAVWTVLISQSPGMTARAQCQGSDWSSTQGPYFMSVP